MNKRKIKITEDGSTTLELLGRDEHFHSTHGAVQESKHIFIEYGLALKNQNKIGSVFLKWVWVRG